MVREVFAVCVVAAVACSGGGIVAAEPVPARVERPITLFNGKDLNGLSPWLKRTKQHDPERVFRVTDGLLHVTGEDFGCLVTDQAYRDYRVILEYKWGVKTDGGKYVRNSGLLVHGTGPLGGGGGSWPASIECQLAQGCNGDLIVIRGKDDDGKLIPVELTSDVILGPDKRPRWSSGGEKRVFTKSQLWWNRHDPTFQELLDTRGKNDVESPLGEWTRVELECAGDRLRVKINDQLVNEAYAVYPAGGRVILQSEGFELFVRRWELLPPVAAAP